VATAALNELLWGPTARERAAGYWSFFSDGTAGMLRRVRISGDTGFADFRDFRRLVPNATSSYGSAALLAELDATLRQFPTIKRTLRRPRRRGCRLGGPSAAGLGRPWPHSRGTPPPAA
jgi:hypothetical protein